MTRRAKLSILIVSWNTKDLLIACLRSIHRFPPSRELEVIVVDNASSDGSAEAVRTEFPNVILCSERVNSGYAQGNNIAFAKSSGDLLLTLNPDTEVYEDTLEAACAALDGDEAMGAIGIQQIGIDGKVQSSVRGFPTFIGVAGDVFGLAKGRPGSVWDSYRLTGFDYSKQQLAPQPMGTFLMFRREAIEAAAEPGTPFMDERFPIFFNEVDLLYRMHQSGWNCVYRPDIKILHYGGESTKQVRKSIIWESHLSLLTYWRKHTHTLGDRLALCLAWPPVILAAFLRAKGYDRGFQPQRDHLQLEHDGQDPQVPPGP